MTTDADLLPVPKPIPTYGVIPTGFNRKPFNTILLEIENALVTEFGPSVIQSPQSPLGQINGLVAMLVTQLWEMAEDVYQSYDVDQAEGIRLDTLGKIRLLGRMSNESDASYRRAITNQDRARIDIQDITRAVASVEGVTYSHVWVNDSVNKDPETGLVGGSLAVAVLGGDDAEIADVLREYVVPGISLYGNTYVSTQEAGYCRTMVLLRPSLAPVELLVNVRVGKDRYGCPPPSILSIREAIVAALAPGGSHQLLNGDDVTHFLIRPIVEGKWPHVEVTSIVALSEGHHSNSLGVQIGFNELATVASEDVTIRVLETVVAPSAQPPPVIPPDIPMVPSS